MKLLNGDAVAAELLAEEVHKDVTCMMENIPELPEGFNFSKMGIWVDPIGEFSQSIDPLGYLWCFAIPI